MFERAPSSAKGWPFASRTGVCPLRGEWNGARLGKRLRQSGELCPPARCGRLRAPHLTAAGVIFGDERQTAVGGRVTAVRACLCGAPSKELRGEQRRYQMK